MVTTVFDILRGLGSQSPDRKHVSQKHYNVKYLNHMYYDVMGVLHITASFHNHRQCKQISPSFPHHSAVEGKADSPVLLKRQQTALLVQ